MQSNDNYEYGAVCLGPYGAVVTWRRPKLPSSDLYYPQVTIMQGSVMAEGCVIPSCDITISSYEEILALHGAIAEVLRNYPSKGDLVDAEETPPITDKASALAFLYRHAEHLAELWERSREGRAYHRKFYDAITALSS